jgi:hypothetical protein
VSQGFSIDVFRSQSSRGKKVVRSLAERLRKDGMMVWLDERMGEPGGSIPATIEEGLEHSRGGALHVGARQLPTLMTEGYFIP